MTGKEILNYADVAMFKAQEQPTDGPRVYLLSCNNDPLGSIAAAAKAYKGEFVSSLAEITDEERRYYLREVQKSALAMPLEAVNFHFRITGVTRGFTHQMVRQRTAAYSQESTRFAVKETVPVGLPPSLEGTLPWNDYVRKCVEELYPKREVLFGSLNWQESERYAQRQATQSQLWRREWDECVTDIAATYNALVDAGMPAEDARGILPTNLLTQLNYFTNLRNYKDEAGKRLCTQAQFEWRIVFSKMMQAIRDYGRVNNGVETTYALLNIGKFGGSETKSSAWQFDAIADLFKPICYYRGSCQFQADFDRACTIRDRVESFATLNVPSSQWGKGVGNEVTPGVPAIHPEEWLLDPSAARVR